jgi:hypothetical protein
MKLANSNGRVNERRINVLNRLKIQLKTGVKTEKGNNLTRFTTGLNDIPLTEQDVKRIEKEIKVLESKIVAPEVARNTRTKRVK